MIHQMKLQPIPFDLISSRKKSIEIRLYDEKRKNIQVGDIIEFTCEDKKIQVKVIGLDRCDTFLELLSKYPMESFGYEHDYPIDELLQKIYTFYTEDEEKEYGVLGIKIILIK